MLFTSSLIENDTSCVWHPFTQMKTSSKSIPIVRAEGAYLCSEDGDRYLDAISSWWVNLHGHSHPYMIEKVSEQLQLLQHVIFAGFTHPAAVELASRLLAILPGAMSKIFYTDNGSTAVEVAVKMALQYWQNKNASNLKKKVICFKNSYHGDTFGAMSASGKNAFNRPFWSHLFEAEAIDVPLEGQEEASIRQLKQILKKDEAACFIFEPLVLGAGGMVIYPPEGLDALIQLCRESSVLTIADEVMTGFGRTGTLFACNRLKNKPDLICLSKGITGGYMALGAVACSDEIYRAFLSDNLQQAFLHGHSYTANPLACSSALASLDLLESSACLEQRSTISALHRDFCRTVQRHPKLKRCESLGTILALEYKTQEASSYFQPLRDRLYHFFLERRILLRPLGNVLYVLPPYCIQEDELKHIYKHIMTTLNEDV